MLVRGDARAREHRRQQLAMVDADDEIIESKFDERIRHRPAQLRLHGGRRRAERIDVALIELAEAAARRPIGSPHRLDLIALEEARQLALILRDDARQRHRQVVAQRKIGLAAGLVLAALENLENELVAFFAVLAEQRLDVLDGRRFERLEAVALVDALDNADDVLAPAHVLRQEVAHAARRFGALTHSRGSVRPCCFWYFPFLSA